MITRQFSFAVCVALVGFLPFDTAFAQRKPMPLVQGSEVGKAVFPPGDTAHGGNGQPVDGIEALDREMLKTHFHSHLALFYRGEQVAIPYGIGIVEPSQAEEGFVGSGKAIYWIHTHDAAGLRGKVRAYVDGKRFRGDPRQIPLGEHRQITLVVGKPDVTPPRYEFPDGL